jgi:hypothetical protein
MANVSTKIPELLSFDFDEIVRSKQALRRRLTALPIAEKLRLLDGMRQRALTIRGAANSKPIAVREDSAPYTTKGQSDE